LHKIIPLLQLLGFAIVIASSLPAKADPATDINVLDEPDWDGGIIRDEVIPAPSPGTDHAQWLAGLKKWRAEQKASIHYNDELYRRPELQWAQHDFIQTQMMAEDRYFYDPATRHYTVDRYLDDLQARYGGIDSVLIWPVYPNMGIDNRSQHDLMRDMPGGYEGLRRMIADFHKRGVHVLFPINPWDTGTSQEGMSLPEAVARNFKAAGIDGVNGDTMKGIGPGYLRACDDAGHALAFETELGIIPLSDLQYDAMNWGYWPAAHAPPVDRYKWVESRHLTQVNERWAKSHIDGLQTAFVNGDGYESWENIWGIWNGLTPRDAEAIRRVAIIERALADFLSSSDWEPLVPALQPDIYAGRFPLKDQTAWLLVNRSGKEIDGAQIFVPFKPGTSFYDIWDGCQLRPRISGNNATLSFPIEGNGFGAILAVPGPLSDSQRNLLKQMASLPSKRLSDYSAQWNPLPQHIVPISATPPAPSPPPDMVLISGGKFHFQVHGVEIEGWGPVPAANEPGVDVQYPWESVPILIHDHELTMGPFYIDKYPVTNAKFKAFLDATHYHPADDHNFLKDWTSGTYPAGWARKPVTWVSLEDARAYAAWAGKRLPHEWEWQYAAQGTDGRTYPWGAKPDPEAIPASTSGHDLPPPSDVDAHPKGASPFGVMDLMNNVWQWTDEYKDEHTRAAILRGGCSYRPATSFWYFPRNTSLHQHAKYLLMCPGEDRAGTVGFRCVEDASR
jgi:iron(II)-dependent oxidoreductase